MRVGEIEILPVYDGPGRVPRSRRSDDEASEAPGVRTGICSGKTAFLNTGWAARLGALPDQRPAASVLGRHPHLTQHHHSAHARAHARVGRVHRSSGGERALLIGDIAHSPAQFADRDWYTVWDSAPAAATAVRNAIADEAAVTGDLIIPAHFPGLRGGRVVENPRRFVLSDA